VDSADGQKVMHGADRAPHRRRVGPAEYGATFAAEDPSTGKVLAEVAHASPADGLRCERRSRAWAAVPPLERNKILRRGYELLLERQEELALLMTLEMGKPLAEARGESAMRRSSSLVLRGGSPHRWRLRGRSQRSPGCW
jgi:acyl-CoA reductase-like NAD-dependent aldehyde dehydrogenase